MSVWNKHSRNLEIIFILYLSFLILSFNCSALKINEIEPNPAGTDKGNEWIELYSSDEVNLGEYKIVNNDGESLNLSGSFSGYYVYTFSIQWLDNSNEKISLYKNNELIDQTDIFKDNANNGKTWSICDNVWEFKESTKGEKNNCEIEKINNQNNENEQENDQNNKNKYDESTSNYINYPDSMASNSIKNIDKKNEVIFLEPKSIKSEKQVLFKSKNEIIKEYALYGFALFCLGVIILFIIDKNK